MQKTRTSEGFGLELKDGALAFQMIISLTPSTSKTFFAKLASLVIVPRCPPNELMDYKTLGKLLCFDHPHLTIAKITRAMGTEKLS